MNKHEIIPSMQPDDDPPFCSCCQECRMRWHGFYDKYFCPVCDVEGPENNECPECGKTMTPTEYDTENARISYICLHCGEIDGVYDCLKGEWE